MCGCWQGDEGLRVLSYCISFICNVGSKVITKNENKALFREGGRGRWYDDVWNGQGKYDCQPIHIKSPFEIHGHEIKVGQVIMVVCCSLTLFRDMCEDIEQMDSYI